MTGEDREYGRILADLDHIKTDVAEIKRVLESKYVTQDQFTPVRNIVYGLVGLILTAVVVALVAVVLK